LARGGRADLQPERSRTQARQQCKGLAYQVIQRSDAWGRLVADGFPTTRLHRPRP
jgi:pyoverdine/dityrosine biosynthesis protein Dit1